MTLDTFPTCKLEPASLLSGLTAVASSFQDPANKVAFLDDRSNLLSQWANIASGSASSETMMETIIQAYCDVNREEDEVGCHIVVLMLGLVTQWGKGRDERGGDGLSRRERSDLAAMYVTSTRRLTNTYDPYLPQIHLPFLISIARLLAHIPSCLRSFTEYTPFLYDVAIIQDSTLSCFQLVPYLRAPDLKAWLQTLCEPLRTAWDVPADWATYKDEMLEGIMNSSLRGTSRLTVANALDSGYRFESVIEIFKVVALNIRFVRSKIYQTELPSRLLVIGDMDVHIVDLAFIEPRDAINMLMRRDELASIRYRYIQDDGAAPGEVHLMFELKDGDELGVILLDPPHRLETDLQHHVPEKVVQVATEQWVHPVFVPPVMREVTDEDVLEMENQLENLEYEE